MTENSTDKQDLDIQTIQFRQLFENSLDAIVIVDEGDAILKANRAFKALFQFSLEEIQGKHLDDLIVPLNLFKEASALSHRALQGKMVREEAIRKRKDESPVHVEVVGFPTMVDDNVVGAYVIYRDITERKKSEEALQKAHHELETRVKKRTAELTETNKALQTQIFERKRAVDSLMKSEEKYRLLAENVTDIIWTMDLNMNMTYISPSATKQRGYSVEEVMAQTIEEILAPGSFDVAMTTIYEALEEEKREDQRDPDKSYVLELELICKDGSTVWTENTAAFLRNDSGQPIGIIGITRDIAARRKAEEARRESEERLTLALQATRDGIWDWNIKEDTIYNSPRLMELLGIEEEMEPSMLFDSCSSRLHPEDRDRLMYALKQHLAGKTPYNMDFLLRDKTGEYHWRNARAMALFDEQGKAYRMVGSVQDIHDRKQAESRVHTLTQELIEAQENERKKLSRELHDRVAQDLSLSKIACDLLLDNDLDMAPEIMQKISEISNMLNSTIYAVRDLAYDLRPPGLEDLGLTQTIYLFCEEFSEKSDVDVSFHYAGIDNLRLNLDAEINIFRLIQEGLNNIWKHAEATSAVIRLMGASPNIILRIEDDGKGFDVKKRMAVAIYEKRMGLRSMEERARLLGGKMAVQSTPNEGTIITAKFPYEENESDSK